ncbi:MAG: tetratricopeptide repeat protein [Longimicrobiaceae bacterium]
MSFSLRLFGAPGVVGPDGPLGGRIAQRHPLALLALLAAAPSATASRERLTGLLWPDSDTEHARGLLNVAVHAVRKALGEGALVSVGASLQLDEAVVRSDLRDFTDALAAGEAERAVEAYAGPYLDGFYLDAEGFDRWADEERVRLAGLRAEALERLAATADAAGDPVRAAAWWRRRAGQDPCDARVALRLMEALAAAGDRAGAIQHARVHQALLRESIGAEPDPEVAALAERLRTEPALEIPASPTADTPRAAAADRPGDSSNEPVPVPERVVAAARRRRGMIALAAAALALGAWWSAQISPAAAPPVTEASVAVLPFADDSRGRVNEYFTDGLADEIIGALSRVDGVRVVARTSAFAFKGRAIGTREVGEQLGVAHVLEGSVREAGDRLRVSVRLVRARDGVPVWSERFDRRMGDVLAVQDEISRAVVRELRDELVAGTRVPQATRPTVDPEAYDLYLQGRFAWFQRTPGALRRALDSFGAAAARDPAYALAYVGTADVYNVLGAFDYGLLPPDSAYPRARAAAERALELDPALGEAHTALANALFNYDWSWDAAGREFRRAVELSPGYAAAHHWYSLYLLAAGRPQESLTSVRRARELDPLSPVMATAMARHLYYTRRYDRSIAEYRQVLATDPGFVTARLGLGVALDQVGEHDAAVAEYQHALRTLGGPQPVLVALLGHARGAAGDREGALEALHLLDEMSRTRYVPAEYRALVHLGMGENESALRRLEEAYRNRSGAMVYLNVEPMLDPLRADPRFQELAARVGLVPTR